MSEFRTIVRAASRGDAAVIARLADRSGDGARAGIRDVSAADSAEIEAVIASGSVGYFVVSTLEGEEIGFAEWRWTGQRVARNAVVGIIISDASRWALGYGAEAIDTVIEQLFYSHDAHRVEFLTALSNYPMITMLARRGGPVLDGVLRDYYYTDGIREDALLWSILRPEFDEFSELLIPERTQRKADRLELLERSRERVAQYLAQPASNSVQLLTLRGDAS